MYGIDNFAGFLAAAIVLNITPGNDTMYILARSISQGKKAGIYSALGISTGGLAHTIFAALGLAVLLSKSPTLYWAIKVGGVAYLLYLAIVALTSKQPSISNDSLPDNTPNNKALYYQGFLTNLLNPKVALFFVALLPQFIQHNHNYGPLPFLLLGLTFLTTGTLWCLTLVCAASTLSRQLRQNPQMNKWLTRLSGLVFALLAIRLLAEL
jgi:threonine/homoserine/homoserine lactone efflux protein